MIVVNTFIKKSVNRNGCTARHRRSQGGAKGPCPQKFLENIVFLCFERRFSKPGVTNLFAIAGHFVSYRWVRGRPVTTGGLLGVTPPTKSSKLPKLKHETLYMSWVFAFRVSSPPHKQKSPRRNANPPVENFLATVLVRGPHNCLVILWNLLKTKKIVHQQKQTTNEINNCWSRLNASRAARNSFVARRPHIRHPCSEQNSVVRLKSNILVTQNFWAGYATAAWQ